jgi:hypothetical protein
MTQCKRQRNVRFRIKGERREVVLIDGNCPIPIGLMVAPHQDPNLHPVLQTFRDAYANDRVTMLLAMGESATVPVIGAIEKFGDEASNIYGLDSRIARLSEFYGGKRFGDLASSHAISYSWFRMTKDPKGSPAPHMQVDLDIDVLHETVRYLQTKYFFRPALLSRIFGPRPPNSSQEIS